MSGIDSVPGQAMRQTGQHLPGAWSPVEDPIEEQTSDPTEGVPLDDGEDITIQDLAIVCPLIDGRMRDVSAGKD
ncbi:hypothetical protein C369_07316 [Cryptococcus neoformans A5-35-17]|nr:hypothetical protein C369_07316 [Cryptococcus neoformans var. grubii A5-35-17]